MVKCHQANLACESSQRDGHLRCAKKILKIGTEKCCTKNKTSISVNDNHPRFLIDAYRTSIAEDAAVGTSFLQVQAVDPDEGPNGIIDYFLNDTDPFIRMDYFRLDRTSGLLQINKPLDRETISRYKLDKN